MRCNANARTPLQAPGAIALAPTKVAAEVMSAAATAFNIEAN
jgi:hypothetical protein